MKESGWVPSYDLITEDINKPIELKGSEGITINGTAAVKYKLNNKFSIALSGGVPFVVRDIRPDGLTRKFVLSPEIIFNF